MLWPLVALHVAGLGPEIGVAPPGPIAPAANLQWEPDVASDGFDFVVVWSDKRFEPSTHRTFGTRIRSDGRVLDPVGIPLGPLHSDRAQVTYLGSGRYLVGWALDGDRFVRVLNANDATWAGPPLDVSDVNYIACSDFAGSGDLFALAYYAGSAVQVRRFFTDGGTPDPTALPLSTTPATCPLIATGPGPVTSWTIAWVEGSTVMGAFLTETGGAMTTALADAGPGQTSLAGLVPLSTGDHFLLWHTRDGAGRPMLGRTISAAGVGPIVPIWAPDAGAWESTFAAGNDDRLRGYVGIGDYANDGHAFVFLPTDAGALSVGPASTDAPGYGAVMAASRDRLLLALSEGNDIGYLLMDQQFARIDSGVASTSGAGQHELQLAASSSGFLAVWTENFDDGSSVLARRLDATGTPVGPTEVLSGDGERAQLPSVAFTGGTWAVVWEDSRNGESHFQLFTEAGQRVRSGAVRAGSNSAVTPHVIADGQRFAIVFVEPGSADIYFTTLERDGGTAASATRIVDRPGFPYTPRIARGTGGFLVVWENANSGDDIYGARLTPAGTSLDAMGFPIAATTDVELAPQVAFDGQAYVVSYRDYSFTRWVRVQGTSVSAPYQGFDPRGTNRLTATLSQPVGVLAASCDSETGRIAARQLVPYGAGLDGGAVLDVALPPELACEPAVTGVGDVLFGYGRFDQTAQAMSAKVRLFTGDPEGAPCIDHFRCLTGYCGSGGTCAQVPASAAGGGTSGAGGGAGTGGSSGTGGSGGSSSSAGPQHLGIGCGCSSAGAPLLLALLLLLRRRRTP